MSDMEMFRKSTGSRVACTPIYPTGKLCSDEPGPIIWGLIGGVGVLALRGIWTKLENGEAVFPKFKGAAEEEEQALIVTIRLCSGEMGDKAERERIVALEHQLSDAIDN